MEVLKDVLTVIMLILGVLYAVGIPLILFILTGMRGSMKDVFGQLNDMIQRLSVVETKIISLERRRDFR